MGARYLFDDVIEPPGSMGLRLRKSNLGSLREHKGVLDVDAEVSDVALDLRLAKQI